MKQLQCALFGHNFKVSKDVTYYVKEYKCKTCGMEMTLNSDGMMVPLTRKYRRINSVLNTIHNKRLEKGRRLFMIED